MSRGPGRSMRRVMDRMAEMDGDGRPRWHDVIVLASADSAGLDVTRDAVKRLRARGQVETRYHLAGRAARLQARRVMPP